MSTPRPLSLTPTELWDEEGEWSLFEVSVGTPPQAFRLLPNTNGNAILIPTGRVCQPGENSSRCGIRRGVFPVDGRNSTGFRANESSTWESIQMSNANVRGWDNQEISATFGFDTVSLAPEATYERRIVGTYDDPQLNIGMLGLNIQSVDLPRLNSPGQTLLEALRSNNTISSLTYGYVAGAYYREASNQQLTNGRVPGSLVLGGTDASRYIPSRLSIPFSNSTTAPLEISLGSITMTNTTNSSLPILTDPITLTIDSSTPELTLPQSVCDVLAQHFRLTFDNETSLYTRSSSADAQATRAQTSMAFRFYSPSSSSSSSSGFEEEEGEEEEEEEGIESEVTITLPYPAFELTHPDSRGLGASYFPIRPAAAPPYVLGRVLLQEAHLTVDHGRRTFSLAQAVYTDPMPPSDIRPILPAAGDGRDGRDGVSGGGAGARASARLSGAPAIAGVAIGVGAALLLLVFAAWLWRRRRRRSSSSSSTRGRDADRSWGLRWRRRERHNPDAREYGGTRTRTRTPEVQELETSEGSGEVAGDTAKWGPRGVQELSAVEKEGELYGNGQIGGHAADGPVELWGGGRGEGR